MFEILPRHNLMLHYQPGPLQACDRYKRCSLVAAEPGQPPPPGLPYQRKNEIRGSSLGQPRAHSVVPAKIWPRSGKQQKKAEKAEKKQKIKQR